MSQESQSDDPQYEHIKQASPEHPKEILLHFIEFFQPLVNLIIRLYIANVFFKSGLTKIRDWHATLDLFKNEYHVPVLPPALAAYMGTGVELVCPILLCLGFDCRFASFLLMIQTAVIIHTYPGFDEHYYWMMLLSVLLVYGAGKISIDHIRRLHNLYSQ